MSYTITNKSKRPIVCPLRGNKTLRLPINGHSVVTEDEITPHIDRMGKLGYVIISENVVKEKSEKKKDTTK